MLIGNRVDNSAIMAGQFVATMAITAAIMQEVLGAFAMAQSDKFKSPAEFHEWYFASADATPGLVAGPMFGVWFSMATQSVTVHMLENMMKWLAPKVGLLDMICQQAQASIIRQQSNLVAQINNQPH